MKRPRGEVDPARGVQQAKFDHHFLPSSYLAGFCDDDGILWEFNRKYGKCRERSPKSAGWQRYLYTVTDSAGNPLNDVEDSFHEHEQHLGEIRSQLESGNALSSDALTCLIQFSAALFVRVSSTVESIGQLAKSSTLSFADEKLADEDRARKALSELLQDPSWKEKLTTEKIEAIREEVRKHGDSNNLTMSVMQTKRRDSEHLLSQKKLTVYHAPQGKSFITTDRPFLSYRRDLTTLGLKGIMGHGTKCCIPFSKRLMLVFHDVPGPRLGVAEICREEWRQLNARAAVFSWRWVYGSSSQQLRSIAGKERLASIPPQPTFLKPPARELQ